MTTIHEVARRAKVSTATVSRAFGASGDVRSETRDRVLAVARELNYRPSSSARNMRRAGLGKRGLTHVIGMAHFLGPQEPRDQFSEEVLGAVEGAAIARGYGLRLLNWAPESALPREIQEGQVDGVLARGSGAVMEAVAQVVPVVTLDYWNEQLPNYAISPDYEAAGYLAAKMLLAHGRSRIDLLAPDGSREGVSWFARGLVRGWRRAAKEAGIDVDPARQCHGMAGSAKDGYRLGRRLFSRSGELPDGVIGPDGGMLGFYRAAAEAGVRLPEQVSVVGINGIRMGEYLYPPLTTVHMDIEAMAARAVEVLIKTIESETPRRGLELTPVRLVERASVAPSTTEKQ